MSKFKFGDFIKYKKDGSSSGEGIILRLVLGEEFGNYIVFRINSHGGMGVFKTELNKEYVETYYTKVDDEI